jgi:uncharacterized membrane protein YkvA (DUF1232 family)
MRITFELEPADIERFTAALARSRRMTQCAEEVDVIDAAKYALDHLCASAAPVYVRKRLVEVQRLILMLEDEAWALGDPERSDVVETLAYFSDPDDLIPDEIEVIGLLDDAIVLELLMRGQKHVLQAYDDFCAYRTKLGIPYASSGQRIALAQKLSRRRLSLLERIQRKESAIREHIATTAA